VPASASQPGPSPARTAAPRRRASGLVAALIVSLAVIAFGGGLVAVYRASVHSRAGAGRAGGRSVVRGAVAAQPGGATGVDLRVTRRFGSAPLLQRSVAPRASEDVLSLLSREATVTTAYGGGFVESIAGIASGYSGANPLREDWFFYVNGVQSHVGAAEVTAAPRDRVWWDFHAWDFAASVPAVVGQFPAPFVTGGRSRAITRVLYADGYVAEAAAITAALSSAGATSTVAAPLSAAALKQPGHAVLVGSIDLLRALPAVTDAFEHPQGSGLFARFGSSGAEALDEHGAVSLRVPGAGAVMATVKPADPDAALWLVTGTAPADVHRSAMLLTDGGGSLAGHFGVLETRDGSVRPLPVTVRP